MPSGDFLSRDFNSSFIIRFSISSLPLAKVCLLLYYEGPVHGTNVDAYDVTLRRVAEYYHAFKLRH